MALVKEERLGDALLLIYGAAAVAIPGLGHLWRGIRVCVCVHQLQRVASPTHLHPAARVALGV